MLFLGYLYFLLLPCSLQGIVTNLQKFAGDLARLNNVVHQELPLKKYQFMATPSLWEEMLSEGRASLGAGEKQTFFSNDCKLWANKENNPQTNGMIPSHLKNEQTVRIATYNVHFWQNVYRGGAPEKKQRDAIMNVIKTINADILILQEVNYFTEIKEQFGALGYRVADGEWLECNTVAGSFFGNVILSKYPCVDVVTKKFEYDVTVNAGQLRCFIKATVQLPQGKEIVVYGTHLHEAPGSDDRRGEGTQRRVGELEEIVADVQKNSHAQVVVAADFNAIRKQDYQYIIDGKLVWDMVTVDTEKYIGRPPSVDELNLLEGNGFQDCFTVGGIPGPKFTVWTGRVVDFIFLRTASWKLPIIGCYLWYSSASDHLPVIMDMRVV